MPPSFNPCPVENPYARLVLSEAARGAATEQALRNPWMNEGTCLGIMIGPVPVQREQHPHSCASPLCTVSLVPHQERKAKAPNWGIQGESAGGVDSAPRSLPSGEQDHLRGELCSFLEMSVLGGVSLPDPRSEDCPPLAHRRQPLSPTSAAPASGHCFLSSQRWENGILQLLTEWPAWRR